jgi:hypothetical protein
MHDITDGTTATSIDLSNPYASFMTMVLYNANQSNYYGAKGSGQFNTTTSFDGISFYPLAGSITGTVSVYGYKKA